MGQEGNKTGRDMPIWARVSIWVVVILTVTYAAVFVLNSSTIRGAQLNESAAAAALKTYNRMMGTFQKKGYAGVGRVYPWGIDGPLTNRGKYCGLYYDINGAMERVTLIGVADANADCRADGDTDAKPDQGYYIVSIRTTGPIFYLPKVTFTCQPKIGYWFGLCMYRGTMPYNLTNAKAHYGLVGFPDDYGSSGESTFIINEEGMVYTLDRGKDGKYLDTFPEDPINEGWEVPK